MALPEQDKERLRTRTVEVVLALRAAYLAEHGGSVALEHWNHLQTRMKSASKRASGPEDWASDICRRLRIPSLSVSSSRCLVDLASAVRDIDAIDEWFALLAKETPYIIALARLSAEAAKDAKEAARAAKEEAAC